MRFRDVWASGSYIDTTQCMLDYFDDSSSFHFVSWAHLIFVSIAFSDCIGQVGVLTGRDAHLSCRLRGSVPRMCAHVQACVVPGAPPMNVTATAISPTAIRVSWQPPPAERANGRIAYYKLLCVESGRGDSEANVVKLNATSFVLDELRRWTEYRIWVLAGTSVGDGPASYPVTIRTHEDGTCQTTRSINQL